MNGRFVREWMKERNLRPEDLAVQLGVSAATIQRILSGYTPPRPMIIALAHVMGVEESDLTAAPKKVAAG